jgi:predicted DNA binding CopG/RHH family protein
MSKQNIDKTLEDFENNDLGDDIVHGGGARMLIGRRKTSTSLVLEDDLIAELKRKASYRGIGYQTMLKIILRENVRKYEG